ncbi:MAG: hypothetical protein RL358_1381 [Pseudomonadota bacterium]|jgi:hypothetical protein
MSNKIALLPGEQVVLSSDNDVLTLTNKRVRYDSVVWGQSNLIGITLGSVASCGLITKSYPFLLILAAVAVLAGVSQGSGSMWGLVFVAAIFVVAYFVTRKAVISVASNGGQEIFVPAKGMNREAIIKFIEAIEREKLK